jgi:hypothetical protein
MLRGLQTVIHPACSFLIACAAMTDLALPAEWIVPEVGVRVPSGASCGGYGYGLGSF